MKKSILILLLLSFCYMLISLKENDKLNGVYLCKSSSESYYLLLENNTYDFIGDLYFVPKSGKLFLSKDNNRKYYLTEDQYGPYIIIEEDYIRLIMMTGVSDSYTFWKI